MVLVRSAEVIEDTDAVECFISLQDGEGTEQTAIVLNRVRIAKLLVCGTLCYHPVSKMQTGLGQMISEELRSRFENAKSVLVLTGAGVSAESGVPTFRGGGQTAVWKGMPFEIISSAGMLERDLPAVWEWFNYRRGMLEKLEPNAGHRAIARWEDRFPNFSLVTQNIDGLHQSAGSRAVNELHGSIRRARCVSCGARHDVRQISFENGVPACFDCGSALRPDVVLFGEFLPPGAFEAASIKAGACDLCVVVGTSAVVYPAAAIPEIARSAGAYVVEVNPEPTPLSNICNEVLTGAAGEILPLFEPAHEAAVN
jgi:NAD-dependent deacetylase